MDAAAHDAEAVEHRHADTGHEAGVRGAAAALDGELLADLAVDALGHAHELVRCGRARHRRQAAHEAHAHLGLGDELVLRDARQVFLDAVELLGRGGAHVALGAGRRGNHVGRAVGREHREVDRGLLRRIGHLRQLQHLVRDFHRGVAARFGRDARVRREPLHLDERRGRALALDHEAVGRAARLEVQRHVVLLGHALDERAGADRARLFVGVDQEGDLAVVLEADLLQDLQRLQAGHDTALVVHHAGAVGAAVLDVEGLGRGRAVLEHGVDVGQDEDLLLALAGQRRDQVGARVRLGGKALDARVELAQFVRHHLAHLGQPFGVGRAGVDVDHALQQLQRLVLLLRGGVEHALVRLLGHGVDGEQGAGQHGALAGGARP
ncbi:hypothetical protein D9M72_431030 [compost metagenome]